MLFDTHAHYNDSRFNELEGGYREAINDAFNSGIVGFINCGTDPKTSIESIKISETYMGNVYAAVGLHPEDAVNYKNCITDTLDEISKLLSNERVVALGEIGLDYHWDIDHDLQHEVFDNQLSMAESAHIPVIIHDRDAHGKTFDIIKCHPNVIGVMHGYSGSSEMAKEYIKMGWYIAFGGPLTYKNAQKVRESCSCVPIERLLIETDCPYLPPVPFRGDINRSSYMKYTFDIMNEIKGTEEAVLQNQLIINTEKLFNIKIKKEIST